MEPFRDDREAAARRIQDLESENDALRNDLFARKAPPPVVREKTGLAPIPVALLVGVPVAVLVLGGLVAFLMMPPLKGGCPAGQLWRMTLWSFGPRS